MKKFYASKKFWFNALTVVTVIATFFGFTPDQELAEKTSTLLVALSPVVNLILTAFFSKKGVEPVV